jgi:hypothetical protein
MMGMFNDLETRCRQVLAPHAAILAQVPRAAWKRFMQQPDADRLALSVLPIQRANYVSAMMIDEARTRLVGRPGVREVPNSHCVGFLIDDEVFLRLKHLDAEGLSSNYPTPRAQRFNANLALDGIPPQAIRLDVGYQLNDLQTEVANVLVVRRRRKKVQWSFSLDARPEVVVLPIQRPLDEEVAAVPAIRARNAATDEQAKRLGTDDKG